MSALPNPPPVVIYSTRFCPYCVRARRLLERKAVPFEEIRVDHEPERRDEMLERSGGVSSVPQIFIGELHIGGCDELHALERAGRLDPLLQGLDGDEAG